MKSEHHQKSQNYFHNLTKKKGTRMKFSSEKREVWFRIYSFEMAMVFYKNVI